MVKDNSETEISYDKLVLATGGVPRSLKPIAGWDYDNIYSFRTVDDAGKISKAIKGIYYN